MACPAAQQSTSDARMHTFPHVLACLPCSALSDGGSYFGLPKLGAVVINLWRARLGLTRSAVMGNGASKVAFRDVLQQLGEEDISLDDTEFWSKLWKTESSPHVSAIVWVLRLLFLLTCAPGSGESLHTIAVKLLFPATSSDVRRCSSAKVPCVFVPPQPTPRGQGGGEHSCGFWRGCRWDRWCGFSETI